MFIIILISDFEKSNIVVPPRKEKKNIYKKETASYFETEMIHPSVNSPLNIGNLPFTSTFVIKIIHSSIRFYFPVVLL